MEINGIKVDIPGISKIMQVYFVEAKKYPYSFVLLTFFAVALILLMGFVENAKVQIIAALILFVPFMIVLYQNRRLFMLSANARHLLKFLGLPKNKFRIGFCLPVYKNAEASDIHGQCFTYSSNARDDVAAMIDIFAVLAKHDLFEETPNPLELLLHEDDRACRHADTIVYIGGPRVSHKMNELIKQDGLVSDDLAEDDSEYAIVLSGAVNHRFSIRPPTRKTKRSDVENFSEDTFACVMKRPGKPQTRFAAWGLDARGTLAAANWLATSWSELEEQYNIDEDEPFTAILRIPPRERHADQPVRSEVEVPGYGALLLPA